MSRKKSEPGEWVVGWLVARWQSYDLPVGQSREEGAIYAAGEQDSEPGGSYISDWVQSELNGAYPGIGGIFTTRRRTLSVKFAIKVDTSLSGDNGEAGGRAVLMGDTWVCHELELPAMAYPWRVGFEPC